MKLRTLYPGADLHRVEKMVYIRFARPHRVLSSARCGGGYRAGGEVEYIGICQGCEPHGDHYGFYVSGPRDSESGEQFFSSERMLLSLAGRAGIPADRFVGLETAADMQNAGIEVMTRKSITLAAVCTAGVETNAVRAGDPSAYDEDEIRRHTAGTINILLAIDRSLTPAAMTAAVITATEAKSAALLDLNAGSTASVELATGTGTDQITVACSAGPAAAGDGTAPLADAGKHSLLGELIGRAVTGAVKRSLELQNGYTAVRRGHVTAQVRRFGYQPEDFRALVVRFVVLERRGSAEEGAAGVLEANFDELDRKPGVAAATAALIHIFDLLRSGVLPPETAREEAALFGAQIASAAAERPAAVPEYLGRLESCLDDVSISDPVVFISRSIALGYADKWKRRKA